MADIKNGPGSQKLDVHWASVINSGSQSSCSIVVNLAVWRSTTCSYRTGCQACPAAEPRPICRQLKPLLPGGDSAAGGSQSPAGQRGWGAPHTLRLRALLAQHAQLLTTTFTMAILTPGSSQAAGIAGQMLHALQVGRHTALSDRPSAKACVATPLYARDSIVCDTLHFSP